MQIYCRWKVYFSFTEDWFKDQKSNASFLRKINWKIETKMRNLKWSSNYIEQGYWWWRLVFCSEPGWNAHTPVFSSDLHSLLLNNKFLRHFWSRSERSTPFPSVLLRIIPSYKLTSSGMLIFEGKASWLVFKWKVHHTPRTLLCWQKRIMIPERMNSIIL